jgi:hypothetical protein
MTFSLLARQNVPTFRRNLLHAANNNVIRTQASGRLAQPNHSMSEPCISTRHCTADTADAAVTDDKRKTRRLTGSVARGGTNNFLRMEYAKTVECPHMRTQYNIVELSQIVLSSRRC